MSWIEAGIPLHFTPSLNRWSPIHFEPDSITYTAYPVQYARALEAVVEAARDVAFIEDEDAIRALKAALDALAAARNEAP